MPTALRESRLASVYSALPAPVADFMTTSASEWESPLTGARIAVPAIPGANVIDVRVDAARRASRRAARDGRSR